MQRDRFLVWGCVAGFAVAVRLHPRQTPLAEDFRLERVFNVERPDHALVPARRVVGEERELAFVVDAKAVRAGARRVVEADLLGLAAFADIEEEEAGARVAADIASEPLGINVENVAIDHAQLMRMHAGRRFHLGDLVRVARVAHVVDGEAFRPVEARAADAAHVSVALVDLDNTSATPTGGRVVAKYAKVFCFFGESRRHASLHILNRS